MRERGEEKRDEGKKKRKERLRTNLESVSEERESE